MSLKPKLSETIRERFDERFTFFVCDQLFTQTEANNLLKQFPTEFIESLRQRHASHATLSSQRHPTETESFLQESPAWREAYLWFTSNEFISDVLQTFSEPILAKYPLVIRVLFRRWILNESRYFGEIQFSLRYTGSVLSPHTDNADKVLALIVYFPGESESTPGGGTSFYRPRSRRSEFKVFGKYNRWGWLIPLGLRRLLSVKLPTSDSFDAMREVGEHLDFFDTHYQLALDAPYVLGGAGGFIKNQFSWHDLRLHDFPLGGVRRSLLVNVFLRPSITRSFINRLLSIRRST